MKVDYNNFAKTFSNSRKNMKWEEIEYFLSFLSSLQPFTFKRHQGPLKDREFSILDIGCGNGRFLGVLKEKKIDIKNYLGIDLSKGLLGEAKKIYPKNNFLELNMLDLDKLDGKKFDYIFLIASFHHLDNLDDRILVLEKINKLLNKAGTVFMTNWALNSELNKEKYFKSIIKNSKNEFGSLDYNIKIGEHDRYYHCFNLSELEYLFKNTGFKIIENRLFENKRNFISIIQKKGD